LIYDIFVKINRILRYSIIIDLIYMIILDSEIGNYVICHGKRYSYFAGNNYLGLASNPLVKEASIRSIEKYGVSFSASRQTTGTSEIHIELEKELSGFKQKDDSAIFASGYLGNSILLEILNTGNTAIFMDQHAHPSIAGGVPKDTSHVCRFKHCDAGDLEQLLEENKQFKPLIITDGVFALTGEIAPLDRINILAKKYRAILVVDDAHSTGILGTNGRGTPEHFGLAESPDIYQSETMSKAIGSYGGFISADHGIINLIREKSAVYQASTSLPPSIVAAGIASLKIIHEHPEMRIRLLDMAGLLRKEIIGLGFRSTSDITPIIPLILPDSESANDLSAYLETCGIIVPVMNYPGMHVNSLLRIAVSAIHTYDQIELLLDTLKKWKYNYGKAYS
jgi:7-keto-8-aminopelargonate synthetase-like enzyme